MDRDKRWKPECGEVYYFVASVGAISSYTWCDDSADRLYYETGNCFRTEDNAEAAAEKVKALLLRLHCDKTPTANDETLQDKQLPKLTAEVFSRPDCPEWAEYAAVDEDGTGVWFGYKPKRLERNWSMFGAYGPIGGEFKTHVFDASDWENSLVERDFKLPEWLKVDATGWSKRYGYFKVIDIDYYSEIMWIQQVEDKSKGHLSFHTVCAEVMQARPRPYNEAEMVSLVGKPITMLDGAVCLCTAYSKQAKAVVFDNMHWDAQELMDSGCIIDGKPCFVLEHLENGAWVDDSEVYTENGLKRRD